MTPKVAFFSAGGKNRSAQSMRALRNSVI